jgi:hypothetical protein
LRSRRAPGSQATILPLPRATSRHDFALSRVSASSIAPTRSDRSTQRKSEEVGLCRQKRDFATKLPATECCAASSGRSLRAGALQWPLPVACGLAPNGRASRCSARRPDGHLRKNPEENAPTQAHARWPSSCAAAPPTKPFRLPHFPSFPLVSSLRSLALFHSPPTTYPDCPHFHKTLEYRASPRSLLRT